MIEWQPIDTAPKDLTEIIVYDPQVGVTVAQYERNAQPPFWSVDTNDFCGQDVRANAECHPTHWMPLPSEPVSIVSDKNSSEGVE